MSDAAFFGNFDSPEGMTGPVSPQVLLAMKTNADLLFDLTRAQPNDFVSFVVRPMSNVNNEQDITVAPDNSDTSRIIQDVLTTTGARQLAEPYKNHSGQTLTLFIGSLGNTRAVYLERVVDRQLDEHGNRTSLVKLIGSMKRPAMPEQASDSRAGKLKKLATRLFKEK